MDRTPDTRIIVRRLRPEEAGFCSDLVNDVFTEHVAPYFPEHGIEEFLSFATPDALCTRMESGNLIYVAEQGVTLAGMVEVRTLSHICLLFVRTDLHRQGVARALLRRAIKTCMGKNPGLLRLTVNASPNSVPAYLSLGFEPTDEEQEKNGLTFTPMALDLSFPIEWMD